MPLGEGKSQRAMEANRRELWAAYREDGRIGNTRPRNQAQARRMIEAIVRLKARESRCATRDRTWSICGTW